MPLNPNIRQSETLHSDFYFDDALWEASKEKIFASTWQWIGDEQEIFNGDENIHPFQLLPNYLDDPLILVKQGNGDILCMSNVCTHRGFLLAQQPLKSRKLVCGYHGRRFTLDGRFEFMPEFEAAEDFPGECDHLPQLPLKKWNRLLFTSLNPSVYFESIFSKMDERIGFLPVDQFEYLPEFDRSFNVKAHWALYCDNFLEGFHIPFVHDALNSMLDYGSYTTEVYDHLVLQTGYSDEEGPTFNLPEGHPDYGKHVAAYYYWAFPNLMFNFYPWGLQVNIVRPISKDRCQVDFLHYIYDHNIWKNMDGIDLADQTQIEDEEVVEGVQRGLASRFYTTGRFSPKREKGVHYFHLLIEKLLSQ